MGRPSKVSTPEQVAAFKRDWAEGLPLKEIAERHGLSSENTVRYTAQRLHLPSRREHGLWNGRWVFDPFKRIQVWVE